MGIIRKQSIVSSIIIYIGFAIGALNIWFFGSRYFTAEQFGLTRVMFDIGQTLFALANLGSIPIMYRFYPYYRDRLDLKERDLFAKMVLLGIAGFILVSIGSLFFKHLIIRKFQANSPLLVEYFYTIYPFTFFLLLFSLLEVQAWNHFASIATNFFKEVALRLLTTFLILMFILQLLNFHQFIVLFSLLYGFVALGLFIYLYRKNYIHFTLKNSLLTRRLYRKMIPFGVFVFLVSFCTILARTFDTILISSVLSLSHVGIFTFASYLTSTLEAPQRGLIAISLPVIAQAWKNKDMARIESVYRRSAVNMLLFSGFFFGLIWLNLDNAITIFQINPEFTKGKTVLLLLGITKIIELGTGVNSQIIVTSRYWKMDFLTNVILLFTLIPLNYLLIKKYGIDGSAAATLIAYFLFNVIRFTFIWVKFKMQPFTWRTLAAIGLLLLCYFVPSYFIHHSNPLVECFLQSAVYTVLGLVLITRMHISPDVDHFYELAVGRVKRLISK